MCSHGLHGHQTSTLSKHIQVELDQIWGRVSDLETLKVVVKASWNTISKERLGEPTKSMPALLQAVIDADGHPTPYWTLVVAAAVKVCKNR